MDTRGRETPDTTQDWHNSPLPEGATRAMTVSLGREGGQTWTGLQEGGLQDRQKVRELVPRPGHYSRSSTTKPPPQTKNPWVRCRGIRSPLGLNTGTRQPTGTGSPPWARLGCWGPFWTWHEVSGPHRIPQQPLPSPWKERQLASVAIPRGALPAPDDYPWTRLTRQDTLKLFPWAQQVLKSMSLDNMERHSWPVIGELDTWVLKWAIAGGLDVRVAAGGLESAVANLSEPRTATCMSEPRTAGLREPRTAAGLPHALQAGLPHEL